MAGETLRIFKREAELADQPSERAPDPDVSVIVVTLEQVEGAWENYSVPTVTTTTTAEVSKNQVIASALINAVLNGLIAFFTYRSRGDIPFGEASIDILITVAIIGFLVSWIGVGSARGEIAKGNLSKSTQRFPKLPKGAESTALIIMLVLCNCLWRIDHGRFDLPDQPGRV